MSYLISFFLGTSVGSFVQVVVTRLNVASFTRSRSKCLSCGEALRLSDLIPILSYLFLRGKCRHCKSPYGIQALYIEVGYGLVFVLLYHFFLAGLAPLPFLWWLAYYGTLFVSLGVMALYDVRHSYLPLQFLGVFVILSLIMMGVRYASDPSFAILLAPLAVGLPFLTIWLLSRGKALGFGDVVLFLAIGAFFGIEQGLAVFMLSIWLGAITGLAIYVRRRRRGNDSTSMPFVPYIVAAFLVVLFTDMDVFSIASLFS